MGRTLQIICGAVVAIGLLGASPPEEPATKKQPEAHQPTRQSPAPTATPTDDHARDLTATCEKGKDNRNSDLCAQWKAADSAEVAASWARLTGVFTGIGLLIGALTTAAAIAAALYARAAAAHTEAGAKAAWASEKVARDTASRQLRAYVGIDGLGCNPAGPHTGARALSVRIKNFGQTPGRRLRVRIGSGTFDGFTGDPKVIYAEDLSPGLFFTPTLPVDTLEVARGIGGETIYWRVEWEYDDAFDASHFRSELLSIEPQQWTEGSVGVVTTPPEVRTTQQRERCD